MVEADVLGAFGREGAFAATAQPQQSLNGNDLVAAYDAYRNYDGQGAVVGDNSVGAGTSDVSATSVYVFAHSYDANMVDLVAINKTNTAQTASIAIAHAPSLSRAQPYDLVDDSTAVVPAGATPAPSCSGGTCTLSCTLPPMSVTTLVMR